MKKKIVLILAALIGFSLLIYMYSTMGLNEILKEFSHFDIRILLLYFLVVLIMDAIMALRWKLILKAYGIRIGFVELFFYNMGGFAVGFLTSQIYVGGEPIRAMLLKRNKVPFKKAISISIIDKSMQITTDLLFTFIGLIILFIHYSIAQSLDFLLLGTIILPAFIVYMYFRKMVKKEPFLSSLFIFRNEKLKRVKEYIHDIEKTIQAFFSAHAKVFIEIFFINFILMLLVIAEYALLIKLFNIPVTIFSTLLVLLGVTISYALPVPMALGTLELSQLTALKFLNLKQTTAISLSLVVRLKDLARAAIGLLSLMYFGISWKKIISDNKNKKDTNNKEIIKKQNT